VNTKNRIKVFLLFILIFNFSFLNAQIEKNSLGHFGVGIGFKNPYGSWGFLYSRAISKLPIEFKVAVGKRQSPCLAGGLNFKLFDNSKKLEVYFNTDYSFNFNGKIQYKASSWAPSDEYSYSDLQFIHGYLAARRYISKDNKNVGALQIKVGYSLIINAPTVNHLSGSGEFANKINKFTSRGLLVAFEFLLFTKKSSSD
jgi:hypothetical protein